MDEIELAQVGCKTEAENSSDEEVNYLLAEPSLLEERDEEMIVISDEEMTEKQENFDVEDLDFKTETTQQSNESDSDEENTVKEENSDNGLPRETILPIFYLPGQIKDRDRWPYRCLAETPLRNKERCQEQCLEYRA